MLEMAKKWVSISNLFFKVKDKKVFLTGTNVPVGKGTFVPAGTFVPFGKGTFVPCLFPALSRPSTPLSMPLLTHTNPTYHPYAYMSLISTAMTLPTQAPHHPLTGYICTRHSLVHARHHDYSTSSPCWFIKDPCCFSSRPYSWILGLCCFPYWQSSCLHLRPLLISFLTL